MSLTFFIVFVIVIFLASICVAAGLYSHRRAAITCGYGARPAARSVQDDAHLRCAFRPSMTRRDSTSARRGRPASTTGLMSSKASRVQREAQSWRTASPTSGTVSTSAPAAGVRTEISSQSGKASRRPSPSAHPKRNRIGRGKWAAMRTCTLAVWPPGATSVAATQPGRSGQPGRSRQRAIRAATSSIGEPVRD